MKYKNQLWHFFRMNCPSLVTVAVSWWSCFSISFALKPFAKKLYFEVVKNALKETLLLLSEHTFWAPRQTEWIISSPQSHFARRRDLPTPPWDSRAAKAHLDVKNHHTVLFLYQSCTLRKHTTLFVYYFPFCQATSRSTLNHKGVEFTYILTSTPTGHQLDNLTSRPMFFTSGKAMTRQS